MKALVTGAGGFVGPHLVAHLIECDDTVAPFDLANGPELQDRAGWAAVVAAERPDVVYHLAGHSDVGGSWNDPVATFEVNTMGTVAILEAARLAGTPRVVIISSAEVYGTVEPTEIPLTEQHPTHPRSPYGASKLAAEDVAFQYHRGHGVEVVVARPFNHLGPGQSTRFAAPSFADQVAAAEAAEISGGVGDDEDDGPGAGGGAVLRHGDLSPKRDLTDVRDVVRAYRLLATRAEPGEAYNVCSGRAVSMAEVLEVLLDLTDASVTTSVDPGLLRPVEIPILQGSCAKLASATGWEPTIGLARTLSDVLDDARRRRSVGVRTGGGRIG